MNEDYKLGSMEGHNEDDIELHDYDYYEEINEDNE
jgi:hypothetical protein